MSVRECDCKYNSRAWCLCDCVCVWNVQTYIISYRLHACTPYHASKPIVPYTVIYADVSFCLAQQEPCYTLCSALSANSTEYPFLNSITTSWADTTLSQASVSRYTYTVFLIVSTLRCFHKKRISIKGHSKVFIELASIKFIDP